MNIKTRLSALIVGLLFTISGYAEEFPGVEKLMSAKEYRAAGLDKLSAAEIEELNQWLIRYTAQEAQYISRNVEAVKARKNAKTIVSQIDGKFSGWNGKTLFKLKNGQVWQQRNSGVYKTDLVDPEVVITRNIMGFYKMKIKEIGRVVAVKRIK